MQSQETPDGNQLPCVATPEITNHWMPAALNDQRKRLARQSIVDKVRFMWLDANNLHALLGFPHATAESANHQLLRLHRHDD